MTELRAYLLATNAGTSGLYQPWSGNLSVPTEVIGHHQPGWRPPDDAAILITNYHYRWEDIHILRHVVSENRIPVLVLADGILEYRNMWQQPILADGAVYQPLVAHKLACISAAQARTVSNWGNHRQCEVVGLPRLDDVIHSTTDGNPTNNYRVGTPKDKDRFRVLIATANQPAFDDSQRDKTIQSLRDVKSWIENHHSIGTRSICVEWRLTDGLGQILGVADVEEFVGEEPKQPLMELLDEVDAVITTPSTVFLESLAKRKPTAILDYTNSPQFIPSSWTISAADHIGEIINELAVPPPGKLEFQRLTLCDQLQCSVPATKRMLTLAEALIECRSSALKTNSKLDIPDSILDAPAIANSRFEMGNLYPDNDVYRSNDVDWLKAELSQAITRLDSLPKELVQLKKLSKQLREERDRVRLRFDGRNDRIAQLRDRIRMLTNTIDALKKKVAHLERKIDTTG